MKITLKTLGQLHLAYLVGTGDTLKTIAAAVGVAQPAVSKYLRGSHPRHEVRAAAKRMLRIPIDAWDTLVQPVVVDTQIGRAGGLASGLPEVMAELGRFAPQKRRRSKRSAEVAS